MKKTDAQLKKKLWKIFSEYIRRRDKGICFTCGVQMDWKYGDAGHFIPKSVGGLALYFHEHNVHFQCKRCNMPPLCGNQYIYGKYIEKRYGEAILLELEALKRQTTKYYPYETQIEYYKKQLELLDAQ